MSLHQADKEIEQTSKSKTIVAELNQLSRMYYECFTHLFSYGKTHNELYVQHYDKATQEIAKQSERLKQLCKDDKDRWERSKLLLQKADKANRLMAVSKDLLVNKGDDIPMIPYDWRKGVYSILDDLMGPFAEFTKEEQRRFRADPNSARARAQIQAALWWGIGLNIVVAFGLLIWFTREWVSRLEVLTNNSLRFARGEKLLDPVGGGDEITQLDNDFHTMADTLAVAMRKERAVVNNAKDLICSIEQNGRFTAVNPACMRIFGRGADELLGNNFSSYAIDNAGQPVQFRTLAESADDKAIEVRVKRKDGTTGDTIWSITWSDEDRLCYCVAHDVTEGKELERLKREVMAMVSHDLRSPLTAVQMYLELLSLNALGELPKKAHDGAVIAERNVSRLIGLINDLLDMERMETGKLQLDIAEVNASEICNRAIEAVLAMTDGRQIVYSPYSDNTLLDADGDRLVQVIVNLLGNAIKFSPEGSTIRLESEQLPKTVEFRIIDQGRGIPADALNDVFDRFKQVQTSDARIGYGSGLGLAICKTLVELHGGTIGVNSVVGEGSTFWFRIPDGKTG